MRKTLLLLLALTGCGPAPAVRQQKRTEFLKSLRDDDGRRAVLDALEGRTDLERALEDMIGEAERELIANSECMWRVKTRCEKGFKLTFSDGFVGGSEYFDESGRSIGEENWSCLGEDRKGKTPRCKELEEVRLCPLALARLRRVAATIEFRNTELRIDRDTAFDTTVFRSVVKFDADPLKPISLIISELKPGVELRPRPLIDRMEVYSLERRGIPLPTVAHFQVGEPLPLPASVYADDCVAPLTVRSHFERIQSSVSGFSR